LGLLEKKRKIENDPTLNIFARRRARPTNRKKLIKKPQKNVLHIEEDEKTFCCWKTRVMNSF
jgi:hypothetical protein